MNQGDDVEAFFHQKFLWMIATLEHTSWNIFFGGYMHKNTPILDSIYTPILVKNFAFFKP